MLRRVLVLYGPEYHGGISEATRHVSWHPPRPRWQDCGPKSADCHRIWKLAVGYRLARMSVEYLSLCPTVSSISPPGLTTGGSVV